jgi:hypothetical protein
VLLILTLGACSGPPREMPPNVVPEPPPVVATKQSFHYQKDIQPIFDAKCAACHGCYDAPCQLKLTSAEGVARGASKITVYDGARTRELVPTRLGIDGLTVPQWRQQGFYPALYSPIPATEALPQPARTLQASLLHRMIALGHAHPWGANEKIPDSIPLGFERDNVCPTLPEFDDYAAKRPEQGMPLAVTGLDAREYDTLNTWIAEGAVVEPAADTTTAAETHAIAEWEHYFNRAGLREQLVSRYLFEHLFIAHLYFTEAGDRTPQGELAKDTHFFELLRSRTPPGEPIVPVATVRPNDDPGTPFYYRLRRLDETIVEKNHILYALSDARRGRFDALFFGSAWNIDHLPAYGESERANPFITFAAIPAEARYRFLLDNAEYFVRSFIRGPVCAGAKATDVIEDQFWVAFENPKSDRYVNDATYRNGASPLLGIPGQDSNLLALGPEWERYKHDRNRYMQQRQAQYALKQPLGPTLGDLWNGDGHNHDALLTIFRHYDNAAVVRGWQGAVPKTLWVMDYPLLERSVYDLVVNFDVFGNLAHQVQTRLYFDLIRNEGEVDFLRFLPPAARNPLLHQWYTGAKVKLFTTYADVDTQVPTRIAYTSKQAKTEFTQLALRKLRAVAGPADSLNRCSDDDVACLQLDPNVEQQRVEVALRSLASQPATSLPVAKLLPELTLLRITGTDGHRWVYSIIHNRFHTNVAFITGEDWRLEPDKDTLTILPGVIGSYPNFMFDVPLADLDNFIARMHAIEGGKDSDAELTALVLSWGVRRTNPDFWNVLHDIQAWVRETTPLEAGVLDINRYANL